MTTLLPYFTSFIRSGMVAFATFLVAHGLLGQSNTDQFVQIGVAFVLAAGAQAWSWYQKYRQAAHVQTAAATGMVPAKPAA